MKKRKPPTIAKLKAKAWKYFSLYIRLKYTNEYGMVHCVTCGAYKHWKEVHAGHYVDGRNNTVLLDERLVHPQCFHCNSKRPGCLAGNKIKYSQFMSEKYGYNLFQLDKLDNLKFTTKQISRPEWEELIEEYKEKSEQLKHRTEE